MQLSSSSVPVSLRLVNVPTKNTKPSSLSVEGEEGADSVAFLSLLKSQIEKLLRQLEAQSVGPLTNPSKSTLRQTQPSLAESTSATSAKRSHDSPNESAAQSSSPSSSSSSSPSSSSSQSEFFSSSGVSPSTELSREASERATLVDVEVSPKEKERGSTLIRRKGPT